MSVKGQDHTILIIDDEDDILDFLSYNLKKEGYKVYTSNDALDGIQLAKDLSPSLIILDVMMPELDGFETLRMLREFSDIPVIMLTAKGDENDKVYGLELFRYH